VTAPGHRWLEHTADLQLEVWAADEPALLLEAARAVVDALTEGAPLHHAPEVLRDVEIDALDAEDRLVRWLNEVLFLATVDGVFVQGGVLALHGAGGLSGRVQARDAGPDAVRAEIKSATYHEIALHHAAAGDPARIVARVVLDV
jgi:SHS2 domain-containing protein